MSPTRTPTRTSPDRAATRPRSERVRDRLRSRPARSPLPVDPRIRRRQVAVAREAGRRRRLVMWSATALLVIATAGFFVLHSSLLAVRVVKVIGAVHTPVAQIEAVAGVASHPPLIDVDPGTLSARLERLPWVATAAVDREWPDGLRIEVTERVPVAVIRVEAAPPSAKTTVTAPPAPWALVDRTGRVLADVASPPAGVVPVSAAVSPGRPGTDVGAGAQPGIEVAASLPRAFSSQVTAVTVAGSGTVTLSMTTPITVDLGNTSELREKYEDVAAILAGAKLSSGDVIDVSVPDAPVVRRG